MAEDAQQTGQHRIEPLESSGLSRLDELCINTIRCLSMDAVQKAKSGHPGMPMGMAPAAYILWTKHLKHNPRDPRWMNRDRFVLSAGHGCMLLYSLLHLTGYDVSLDDIKSFRQWGSKTPGHPEYGHTPGVELTTGPLGQGISSAVGMAIAEKYLAEYFNRPGFPLVDYKIYVVAGDGCMQEGVTSESCSLGAHLGLNNLIAIYDDNRITIDGKTSLSFSEDVGKRYESYGWFVQTPEGEGNDMASFERALIAAQNEPFRPSLIKLRTHIAYGSPNKQDSPEAHGSPLGEEEVALTKKNYGWDPVKKFYVPEEALAHFREEVVKGKESEGNWNELFVRYAKEYPVLAEELLHAADGKPTEKWEQVWANAIPKIDPSTTMATREAQGRILDAIMPKLPLVLGGSADLTPSNNTRFRDARDFSKVDRLGRYIRYGVREHGMAAIMNGIAVSGLLIPYGGTFFCFSDYMRPALRLAALSRYPVIFVYTHDSIGLGEDGPTHQAVEHLASLRAIPGLVVLRPADFYETAYAWKFALEHRSGPTVIALTRQRLPVLDQTKYASAENLCRGAYILIGSEDPQILLLATGSEVSLAVRAYDRLTALGISARLVSIPSFELFEQQSPEYKDSILPAAISARVAVEAGVRMGWDRYLGSRGEFIGMTTFGASAPAESALENFGFTVDHVVRAAERTITRSKLAGT